MSECLHRIRKRIEDEKKTGETYPITGPWVNANDVRRQLQTQSFSFQPRCTNQSLTKSIRIHLKWKHESGLKKKGKQISVHLELERRRWLSSPSSKPKCVTVQTAGTPYPSLDGRQSVSTLFHWDDDDDGPHKCFKLVLRGRTTASASLHRHKKKVQRQISINEQQSLVQFRIL